jgi:hypothetical protein
MRAYDLAVAADHERFAAMLHRVEQVGEPPSGIGR